MGRIRRTINIGVCLGILGGIGLGGVALADYPPVQQLIPSARASEVAFDRTPSSVPALARRTETPAPLAGGLGFIRVFVGEPVVPVLTNFPRSTRVRLTLTTPSGIEVNLPSVFSNANGRLRFPALEIAKAGRYSVRVVAANGTTRTLILRVGR